MVVNMKVSIIGCGRWGSFITWYLNKTGHRVSLYGRRESRKMAELFSTRSNGTIALPESVTLTTKLAQAVQNDVLVISVGSQGLRALMQELTAFDLRDKTLVMCMKGLEISTGKRLTEIVKEYTDTKTAVWLGPGHAEEFVRGIPNCMVIDSADDRVKETLVEEFSSDLIRFYYGKDLIGNEIGAAAKNVIGIAAGMLDGLELSSLKGALMSRGTREIARLIHLEGGSELSAYGLCHLGDYEATVFSKYSHNRQFGEKLIKGECYSQLAEGYHTVKALMLLAERNYCALPICTAVYQVIYEEKDAKKTLDSLFSRSIKNEF